MDAIWGKHFTPWVNSIDYRFYYYFYTLYKLMTVTKTGFQKEQTSRPYYPDVVHTTESPSYLQLVSTFQSYDMT